MEYVFFWVLFSFLVVLLARRFGRSGAAWFFISLIISPLLAMLFLLVLSPREERIEARQLAHGGRIRCRHCNELIRAGAATCKHCSCDQMDAVPTQKPSVRDHELRTRIQQKLAGQDPSKAASVMDLTRH